MRRAIPLAVGAGAIALAAFAFSAGAADRAVLTPPPKLVTPSAASSETAYFAGGCFWGVEGVFDRVKGVKSAVSGYAGGKSHAPTYAAVSTGSTGHAETVRVIYDPRVVRYADLLQIYFSVVADPTLLNRQGPDVGTQYRTALFPVSDDQRRQARAYIAQLGASRAFARPIVTSIEPLGAFTPAESYHQDYLGTHLRQPYIVINDLPKVAALKRYFPQRYRG